MTDEDASEPVEADAGPNDRAAGPERLCIATRTVQPVGEMIRFVVGPDNAVVPDIRRKLPGRGVWVTASAEALAKAVTRGAFARGFRRAVSVPKDLVALTDQMLEQRALDSLSMVYKAGVSRMGFAKVEEALDGGKAVAVIHAAEASADGMRKLAAASRRGGENGMPVTITSFTAMQLDLAFGRPNVIHAALLAGPASEAFLSRFRDLMAFRAADTAGEAATASI